MAPAGIVLIPVFFDRFVIKKFQIIISSRIVFKIDFEYIWSNYFILQHLAHFEHR